jgi:hypothetical protein
LARATPKQHAELNLFIRSQAAATNVSKPECRGWVTPVSVPDAPARVACANPAIPTQQLPTRKRATTAVRAPHRTLQTHVQRHRTGPRPRLCRRPRRVAKSKQAKICRDRQVSDMDFCHLCLFRHVFQNFRAWRACGSHIIS